jgi:hypothetical protein
VINNNYIISIARQNKAVFFSFLSSMHQVLIFLQMMLNYLYIFIFMLLFIEELNDMHAQPAKTATTNSDQKET